jgi:hypothetical protein
LAPPVVTWLSDLESAFYTQVMEYGVDESTVDARGAQREPVRVELLQEPPPSQPEIVARFSDMPPLSVLDPSQLPKAFDGTVITNLRGVVLDIGDVAQQNEPRRPLRVRGPDNIDCEITVWNQHTDLTFAIDETYLFVFCEATCQRKDRENQWHTKERRVNVWSTCPILQCVGELSHLRLLPA